MQHISNDDRYILFNNGQGFYGYAAQESANNQYSSLYQDWGAPTIYLNGKTTTATDRYELYGAINNEPVAVTAIDTNQSLWVDTSDTNEMLWTGSTFSIGAYGHAGYGLSDGVISEVIVFKSALTEQQQTHLESSQFNYFNLSNGSAEFDGSSHLTINAQAGDIDLSGDYTIEFWVKLEGGSEESDERGGQLIADFRATEYSEGLRITIDGSSKLGIAAGHSSSTPDVLLSNSSITSNEWVHCAISREAGLTRLFIDGALDNTATDTSQYHNGYNRPMIGANGSVNGGSNNLIGSLSNLRITSDTALYTDDFTPGVSRREAVNSTDLLLFTKSNRLIDESSKGYEVFNSGVQVSDQHPFMATGLTGTCDYESLVNTIGPSRYFTFDNTLFGVVDQVSGDSLINQDPEVTPTVSNSLVANDSTAGSFAFNGSLSYRFPQAVLGSDSYTTLSVVAWYQPSNPGNGDQVPLWIPNNLPNYGSHYHQITRSDYGKGPVWRAASHLNQGATGGDWTKAESLPVTANQPYMIYTSVDVPNDKLSISVNGSLTINQKPNWSLNEASNRNNFSIGAKNNNEWFYEGLIDEVAIFNRPLDQAEIDALYASGSGACTN